MLHFAVRCSSILGNKLIIIFSYVVGALWKPHPSLLVALLIFKFSCSKPVRWLRLQLYNFSDIQRVPPTDPRHPSTCFVLGAGHPRFRFWTVNISKHISFETICLHEFIGGLIWGMPYRRSGCFFAQVSMLWQILLKQNRTGLRHGTMMGCKRLTPRMTPHKWGMNVMSHEA